MDQGLKFDQDYSERVLTRDGVALTLRLVRPSDKEKLLLGFAQLSARSRYLRFFASKRDLTDEELRFFTEIDCDNHFAIGALERGDGGSEGRGVGVVRFIRESEEPATAEVAITVIDEMQRRGVGRILLERLVDAARERGIARFRFECLAQNRDVQKLVKGVCEKVEMIGDGEVLVATAALPEPNEPASAGVHGVTPNLYHLLRAVARDAFSAQLAAGFEAVNRTLDAAKSGGVSMLSKEKRDEPRDT